MEKARIIVRLSKKNIAVKGIDEKMTSRNFFNNDALPRIG